MNTHNFKSFRRNNSRIVKENGIVAQLAELTRVQKKRKNVVWSRIRVKFRSVTYRMRHSRVLNLLHLACEDVERHYGTSLAMYFYLIRILVWLDLILFIIALALIIIPWSLYYRANPSLTSLPNFQGTILSLVGVLPENIVTQEQPNILSQLPLYYGSYSAVMRGNTMGPTWTGTIILIYLVSLIIFLYHISRSVLKSLHSSETIKCLQAYAAAISWDWNVQDARVARSRKVATLIEVKGHINDLRQDIYDKMEESSSEFWNGARKARLRSFIGILLSILLLAGSLTALYFTIVNQGKLRAIFPYLHTIIISFINGAIPFFQRLVVAFQQLKSPQKILNRELLGTYLIKMMNIVFLVFQTNESRSSTGCVELDLGTTYVQLVLISAGASIVMSIAYLLLYYLLGYHTRQTPSADIIDTFYLQCMLFVLQSYNPFAFLYGLVLLLAVFTVKYAVIFRATQPPIDLTLVESNATMMLLLSGVLVFAAVPTFFFLNKEDITCGPFIGISPLNSFSDYLATSRFIRDVSRWLFNPLILVTVVILLLVLAIVMFAVARRNAIQSGITSANLQDEIRELKNRIGRSVALLEREKERNNALITTPIDANFLPGPKKADILEVEEYAPAFVTLRELTSAKGRDVEAISKKKSVRFEGIQSVASFGTEPTSPHFENKEEKVSYMLQAPIFTFEDIIPYLSASRLKPFNFKL